MRIPKKIKIGGHDFKVVVGHLKNAMGECDYANNTITISNKLSKSQQEVTFIHEILHALNAQFDESSMAHAFMESLSQQVYQVFNENKLLK